jgi:hypothetical protein
MIDTLFSYGTLQLRDVQLANYGRELEGEPDALVGYCIVDLVVADPNIVSLSGTAVHPIARHTGDPADRVEGMRFDLSEAELAATDDYEVEPYRRVEVTLESGRTAWAYVGPPLR